MANKKTWLVMLASALALGMGVVGCDGGDDGGGGGNTLPVANGANALSGKIYVDSSDKIEFSTTAEGAANGTYKILSVKRDSNWNIILVDGKYTYIEIETGSYTWDETAKTVTTGPEKAAIESETGYGALQDKTGYRSSMQTMLNQYKDQMGEAAFNAALRELGFSSVAAYLNYYVADAFKNVTRNYAFSADNKALFLDEVLPANKGTNELAGQTYNSVTWNNEGEPVKDTTQTYVFTETSCTYTGVYGGSVSNQTAYTYAYDSAAKRVYLKPPTTGRESSYTQISSNTTQTDNFASADEYNAAQVNDQYNWVMEYRYDTAEKTLR